MKPVSGLRQKSIWQSPDSEKPSWSYAADRSYTFDSVHCEVDLEYSYGERDNCTLFYGERGEGADPDSE